MKPGLASILGLFTLTVARMISRGNTASIGDATGARGRLRTSPMLPLDRFEMWRLVVPVFRTQNQPMAKPTSDFAAPVIASKESLLHLVPSRP